MTDLSVTEGRYADNTPVGNEPLPDVNALRDLAVAAVSRCSEPAVSPLRAAAIWRRLVRGQCRVVEWFERGGCHYYVVQNQANRDDAAALDEREERLAEILGCGESEKVAAYALGMTPSAVSSALTTLLRKIGLRSRMDLVLLVRSMRADVPPPP